MTNDIRLSSRDLEHIAQERVVETLSRPSLSYWQDAWIRLKGNRRALISLYIVIALLAFTLIGPLLWSVDPSVQDLDQISQPPGVDRRATLVAPHVPWHGGEAETAAVDGLRIVGAANSQAVRLAWNPIPGAVRGYRIYRNIFPIGPEKAYGLPLVMSIAGTWYEDLLDLKPRDYYYTVVGLDEHGVELPDAETIEVTLPRVITIDEARGRGLIAADATPQLGDPVTLALHPLGTDALGRDLLARLMHGARVSLFIGIVAPFLYVMIGVAYGAMAGFIGGRTDAVLMRFADFVVALPFLLFMILFKVMFGLGAGESGIVPMLIAMVILSWPATSRLVRGQILSIREEGYIGASRLLGAATPYLVMRHMIPNTMGVILVTLTFAVPSAIFTEAFLSFIGMGVAPPTPSWGSMCNEGIKTMLTTPHELLFPSILISITVLAFNLLGDGLRDALDARMRSRE
ncbi:MAG: ABC transporter permease [Pseudomonadales bacterium]